MNKDILVGIDAGTSWIKAVAFDVSGQSIASCQIKNEYTLTSDGGAEQSPISTWERCTHVLQQLHKEIDQFSSRVVALSVTGQGDGTWLIDCDNQPVGNGWLWLDSRAGSMASVMSGHAREAFRFERTGTALNCCQMAPQLRYILETDPARIDIADQAIHCKDWLYLKLTGVRASDPSEGIFTFGDFRKKAYDEDVFDILGLTRIRRLIPEIIDGVEEYHPLTDEAAAATGLLAGTPVILGYVDVVCTALGSGVWTKSEKVGCTILGSTGMHIKAQAIDDVVLSENSSGYVMMMPIPGIVAQIQTNMSATLNIDWILDVGRSVFDELDIKCSSSSMIEHVERWLETSSVGSLIFHPYISEAGERGPFINANARANFFALNTKHRFPDLVRGVVEGIGFASRDCYEAMGELPKTICLTGGAAQSDQLRSIFGSITNCKVKRCYRGEAGAAGAAMISAVCLGIYDDMEACIDKWVLPYLSDVEEPSPALARQYNEIFQTYTKLRGALTSSWAAFSPSGKFSQ